MVAWRYGISLLVFNSISHSFATLTRAILRWTLEEKFHISARPCIIVYLSKKRMGSPCIHRRYYMAARRCEFYFRVAKTVFYERAQRVSKFYVFPHEKIKSISSSHRVIIWDFSPVRLLSEYWHHVIFVAATCRWESLHLILSWHYRRFRVHVKINFNIRLSNNNNKKQTNKQTRLLRILSWCALFRCRGFFRHHSVIPFTKWESCTFGFRP